MLVLSNERHQLSLVINHEHLLHIAKAQAIVGVLSRPGNLVSDSINELLNEKVVGNERHVLLLLKNLLVAALHEIGLEGHWNLDVEVSLDILLRDELNLSVVL